MIEVLSFIKDWRIYCYRKDEVNESRKVFLRIFKNNHALSFSFQADKLETAFETFYIPYCTILQEKRLKVMLLYFSTNLENPLLTRICCFLITLVVSSNFQKHF